MSSSYTLRDLPLPVKVVATVFLLAVGAGYTSAMLQLHIQDAKSGKPMPTPEDVILKFTGKKKADPNAPPPRPVSRLEALITGEVAPISGNSMTAAFTTEDRSKGPLKFGPAVRGQLPEVVAQVKAERKGEQEVFALWINTPDAERKASYTADKFTPPPGTMPKAFTPLLTDGNAVKIKTLIDARCATCHSKGGEKGDIPLDNYECLARYMEVPPAAPAGSAWVQVQPRMEIGRLTQSTHAHLLSFATLFSLTGLIFALSSWPAWIRVLLGPSVVIAVFADVSLWWLATLCDQWGPYFALGVMATGGIAGLCLGAQITLSLFNMYGVKGKAVIALLFLLGALAGTGFVVKLLIPALPKPKAEQKQDEGKKPEDKKQENPKPGKSATEGVAAAAGAITDAVAKTQGAAPVTVRKPATPLERLLMQPPVDEKGIPLPDPVLFSLEGTMVPAFFDKDKKYKEFMEGAATQAEKDKLKAHRQGDLDALLAWVRAAESARKLAYESDTFDLPGLSDKTITPEFVKDGKVRIKSLIDNRCATCHREGKAQGDYPLDTYKGFAEYLKPYEAPAPKGDGNKGTVPPAPRQPLNDIDRLLRQPPVDKDGNALEGKPTFNADGTMVPAFFEKDPTYKKFVDDANTPQTAKDKLKAERQGDLDALAAWARATDDARKAAYETDTFDLPGLSDKTITPEFVKDGKVRIKSLIDNRCATCHREDKAQSDYPLDSYKGLSAYLKPLHAPVPKGDGKKDEVPAPPAPAKTDEPALPIAPAPRQIAPKPDAKDD